MFDSLTVFDGILALMVLIGLIVGCKVGFFKSVANPLKLVIAGCLTVCLASPIINAWTRPFFTKHMEGWIYDALLEKCPEVTGETASALMPGILRFFANLFKVDLGAVGEGATSEDLLHALSSALAAPIGNAVAVAVTYLGLFIILSLLLTLLIFILDSVVSNGPLEVVNRILGLILGFAISAVLACIVANIAGYIAEGEPGGFVYQFFKKLNPFDLLANITIT